MTSEIRRKPVQGNINPQSNLTPGHFALGPETAGEQDVSDESSSMIHEQFPTPPTTTLFTRTITEHPTQKVEAKYVQWGIHWRQPSLIALCFFTAIALALGHHFYYSSLNGTVTGSAASQRWAVTIGTALAFLVIHLLGAAAVMAYSQYIWMVVKRRGYSLAALDNFFAMTSDPTAFFQLEIFKHGKVPILLALITWLMGIPSVSPPGTLTVVSALQNKTTLTSWPSVDWTLPGWINDQHTLKPSHSMTKLATVAAYEMDIRPITAPHPNSTFNLNFYGPSLQCRAANETQKPMLNYYTQAIYNQSYQNSSAFNSAQYVYVVTEEIVQTPRPNCTVHDSTCDNGAWNSSGMRLAPLVFSAFAPNEACPGWYGYDNNQYNACPPGLDEFNNWHVHLPSNFYNLTTFPVNLTQTLKSYTKDYINNGIYSFTSQQLYIQGPNTEIVCTLGNASYDLSFSYINGVQTIIPQITNFTPLYLPLTGYAIQQIRQITSGLLWPELPAYMAIFTSLTSLLSGNITLTKSTYIKSTSDYQTTLDISTQTSRALFTGLVACSDLAPDFWFTFYNGTNHTNVFSQPEWMCRNRTLAPAIEDLFTNITVSMLAAEIPGIPNENIPITTSTTQNIYIYTPFPLILSYALAVFFSLLSISIGFYAVLQNGVSHSSSFSAIMATTRNARLDQVVEGASLGALPLDGEMRKTKLRFGVLGNGNGDGERVSGNEDGHRHIAFGLEDEVEPIRKGGRYT